jgi:hypothetical protein
MFIGQTKSGEIAMAYRPTTDEEGSKGGARSILTFAVVAAGLFVLLLLVGVGNFGSKKVAPESPQPSTEAPATSGSPNP